MGVEWPGARHFTSSSGHRDTLTAGQRGPAAQAEGRSEVSYMDVSMSSKISSRATVDEAGGWRFLLVGGGLGLLRGGFWGRQAVSLRASRTGDRRVVPEESVRPGVARRLPLELAERVDEQHGAAQAELHAGLVVLQLLQAEAEHQLPLLDVARAGHLARCVHRRSREQLAVQLLQAAPLPFHAASQHRPATPTRQKVYKSVVPSASFVPLPRSCTIEIRSMRNVQSIHSSGRGGGGGATEEEREGGGTPGLFREADWIWDLPVKPPPPLLTGQRMCGNLFRRRAAVRKVI
ncbi:unnamed protein product [Menidia menidia]|uniref:(Atlantic silverside) hypothetical protein n=1 Tax=Menidia menidia TaxID=238744 RepID=A0A8S4AFB8_9TELE|nr:unnamed protein product [Menidia menidia]